MEQWQVRLPHVIFIKAQGDGKQGEGKMKRTMFIFLAPLLVTSFPALTVAAITVNKQHQSIAGRPCGVGTIAFRAQIGGGEKRFTCSECSWYDGGLRQYAANLSAPARSHHLTLVVIHVQNNGMGSERGMLLTQVARIRDASARTLRGTIDFSSVYSTSPPAGGRPFGTYLVSIYRGMSVRGQRLAQGEFQVIED